MSIDITTAGILDLFRPIHGKIRDALAELDPQVLHWRPGPETNSVAALIQHIVWTERGNLLRIIGKVDPPGSRGLEDTDALGVADLLGLLDRADAFLGEMAKTIPTESLATMVTHPHRGPSTALVLILQTYGHVQEHFGHLELTRQLCLQNFAPATA